MLKSTRIQINKALKEKQEDVICKYINRFNKINKFTCLYIIVKATNYFICFENYMIDH